MPEKSNIEEIFKEYKSRVYRLALSISRNPYDAEDIMQNTFFKVIKNLKYFRHKSRLSTWIYKITYNEALMHLRRRKSQFRLTSGLRRPRERGILGLFVNWAKLPDEQLLDKELKERIDITIRQMPIMYRAPLLLDNVEGLKIKESAKILNLKENSLKTRLHRANLIIRAQMSDYFKDKQAEFEEKEKRCPSWVGFLYKYALGNLGKDREEAFRRHIKDCASCNSFLDSYKQALKITRALECRDIPDALKEKIENFISSNK